MGRGPRRTPRQRITRHRPPRFGYTLRGRIRDPLQKRKTVRDPGNGIERYEVNPETGPILAELYRRYIAGSGGPTLVAWLNEAAIPTTRGRHWSDAVLMRMLDAGFGAGLLRVHDPNCECSWAASCKTKILVPGAHQPVISEHEWQARQRRLRVAALPPRARVTVYPLTGLIWCGHCGARMTATADGKTPAYWYRCGHYLRRSTCEPRSMRRTKAETAVLGVLQAWVEDIDAKSGLHPEFARPIEPTVNISRLQASIAAADTAITRLTVQLAKQLVTEEAYRAAHAELVAERADCVARLTAAQAPRAREPHDYVPVVRTLLGEWPTWPGAERREMLARVVTAVRGYRTDRKTAWLEVKSAWGETRRADLQFFRDIAGRQHRQRGAARRPHRAGRPAKRPAVGGVRLAGLGSGLVISPNQTLALSEVPVARAGTAGGVLQTGQRIGTATGIAAIGSVFFTEVASSHGDHALAFRRALLVTIGFVLTALAVAVTDVAAARRT